MLAPGFVYLHLIAPHIAIDAKYAGSDNFLGYPVRGYEAPFIVLSEVLAEKVIKAEEFLHQIGLGLLVLDGYRPMMACEHFWEWANDNHDTLQQQLFYPAYKDKTALFQDGFISKQSMHSKGIAVDLTLINKQTLEPLDMGGRFDLFSHISYTESTEISIAAQQNRRILLHAMQEQGLENYRKEWWHFQLPYELFPGQIFNFPIQAPC